MLDWIINPEGVGLSSYMILWAGLVICVGVGVAGAFVAWFNRDKNKS